MLLAAQLVGRPAECRVSFLAVKKGRGGTLEEVRTENRSGLVSMLVDLRM
jgi:hypothetical protein